MWCGKVKGAVVCSEKNPSPGQSSSSEALEFINGLPNDREGINKLIQAVEAGEIK